MFFKHTYLELLKYTKLCKMADIVIINNILSIII